MRSKARTGSSERSRNPLARSQRRRAARALLVAAAVAALILPMAGEAAAQFSIGGMGGMGGFGGRGGFGRGGDQMRGMRTVPTRMPGHEMVLPGRGGRFPGQAGRIANPKGDGVGRPGRGCRSGDCPRPPRHRPPRWPGGIVVDMPPYVGEPVYQSSAPPRITRQAEKKTKSGKSTRSAQQQPPRRTSGMPPAGETRYVPDQVLCVLQGNLSERQIDRFVRDNRLARTNNGAQRIALVGARVFRFRITDRRPVPTVIAALERDRRVVSAQPNYLFALAESAAPQAPTARPEPQQAAPVPVDALQESNRATASEPVPAPATTAPAADLQPAKLTAPIGAKAIEPLPAALSKDAPVAVPEKPAVTVDPLQYALAKLHVPQAHRVAKGERVLVAVIDSRIDAQHPELAGTIAKEIDLLDDKDSKAHAHGTAMAGAIVAKSRLLGVAPEARVLALRAFTASSAGSAAATTFDLTRAVDRAVSEGARVVNLSFAGPHDPLMARSLKAARERGIVLIAAAGNAGPQSGPLYPAADGNVIAVTATDADDNLYQGANRGKYIAVAAPGVEILVPAPQGNYDMSTGTSVAAAHVSGVAALLLARKPSLDPEGIRKILTTSARDLGSSGHDDQYGAGLADAYNAILALDPKAVDGGATSAVPAH